MYFYQRLRDMREDFELTQAEVAKILNTHKGQYLKYENGHQELPMHHTQNYTKCKFYLSKFTCGVTL